MSDAPRSTAQAAQFLLNQHRSPSHSWLALCLRLQREARGLPGVYPSALSAALATPLSERVHKVSDLRRGMVAYSDDPHDSNPYGHIYFIAGWKNPKDRSDPSTCLTWSNDIGGPGLVSLVPLTAYRAQWGDTFQFGATWLNGYDFSDFNVKATPKPTRGSLGDNYNHAIEDVERALAFHHRKGNKALVKMLQRDLKRMRAHQEKWSEK